MLVSPPPSTLQQQKKNNNQHPIPYGIIPKKKKVRVQKKKSF